MEQNLKLDTKQFIEKSLAEMLQTYKFAYPYGTFDINYAHANLAKIKGSIKVLQNFMEALKEQ